MDDRELEQAMREGLQRRAEDVDTSAPSWSAHRAADAGGDARAERGHRPGGRLAWSPWSRQGWRRRPGGDEPDAGERVGEPQPLPDEWRTEYWHDMSVDVPADWGYGGAPMDDGTGEVVACWPSAMVSADGTRLER